jgi:HK97 family phage major capsid protein
VPAAFQSPTVVDLIPVVQTDQNAYVFMRQSTRTNNAAEVAESVDGDLKSLAESAFVYSQISETVRKIGHFVPVTDEQMEDIPGIEAIIRNDMIVGLRQRLSSQIMNGNGSAPNLTGFLDDGHTPTDVNGTSLFYVDIVDKCIESVRVNGFTEPTAIITHPADWHAARRSTTTEGIYLLGSPAENTPPTLWGLPVILTTEIAAGTVHVGNYADYSRLVVKRGVEVSISSEHASYFLQGVKAVKAEMRAAFAVLRETAFAKSNDVSFA